MPCPSGSWARQASHSQKQRPSLGEIDWMAVVSFAMSFSAMIRRTSGLEVQSYQEPVIIGSETRVGFVGLGSPTQRSGETSA